MFRFSIRDLLWLTLVVAMGLGWWIRERQRQASATIGADLNLQPRFLVVVWEKDDARIIKQGVMSQSKYRRLFLKPYVMAGERYHAPQDSAIIGVVVAHDASTIVTVPIRTWKVDNGTSRFLCQASDDGRAPLFSAFAHSEDDMLARIYKDLEEKEDDG